MSYNFQVQHVQGKVNQADGLSRLPGSHVEAEDEEILVAAVDQLLPAVSCDDIGAAGEADSEIQALIDQLPRRWPHRIREVSDTLKPFFRCRNELSTENGLVFRGDRIIVPSSLRAHVTASAHSSHPGIVRTKQRLRAIFWWPGMDRQVEEAIKNCPTCSDVDKTTKTCRPPLIPVALPPAPWEKVGIDFVGPMPGPVSQRYAIVLTDYYSKWPEVGFVSEPSTNAVTDFLTSVASREGWPKELVSDNGTHFTSQQFASFLRDRGVKHIKVSPYHPAGAGAVERFNRSLKASLQIASRQNADRRSHTQRFLMVYRATPHATTGRSPSELLHGRQLRTELENAVARSSRPTLVADDSEVRARVCKRQKRMKELHDRRSRKPNIKVGDIVRYRLMPKPRKGQPRFSKPCLVTAQRGPVSFELEGGIRVHAERLSPCRAAVCRSTIPEPAGPVESSTVSESAEPAGQSELGLAFPSPLPRAASADPPSSASAGSASPVPQACVGADATLPSAAEWRSGDGDGGGVSAAPVAGDGQGGRINYRTRSGREVRCPLRWGGGEM